MMNLKNKIFAPLLLVLLISVPVAMEGQVLDVDTDVAKNIITPPPTTSELCKYVEIPVSLYTGVPNISIPLYDITVKNYSLPISLSYHSSGIKVSQRASWAGLGWSLNAGGVISRVAKGTADDQDTASLSYPSLKVGKLFSDTDEYPSGSEFFVSMCDSATDHYFYNFNGHSGKFYFNDDNDIILSSEKPYDITYEMDGLGISSISFVTDDGTAYLFEDREIVTVLPSKPDVFWGAPKYITDTSNFIDGDHPLVNYRSVSGWYISKIILPNAVDTISFEYSRTQYSYMEFQGEIRKHHGPAFLECHMNWDFYNFYIFQTTLIDGLHISEINWNGGSVEFNRSSDERVDVVKSDVIGLGYQGTERALDEVVIKDGENNTIKKYELAHNYFEATGIENAVEEEEPLYKRLRLDSITEISSTGSEKPPYVFTYNEEGFLPDRYNTERDFWGYYNGNDALDLIPKTWIYANYAESVDTTLFRSIYFPIPRSEYGTASTILSGGDRTAKADSNQVYILEKIQYPTGGMDEFTYETNQFVLRDSSYYGGGLRIKQIKTKESATETAKIRNYTYNDGNASSGKIVNFPLFAQYRNHTGYSTTYEYLTDSLEIRRFSNSITGLETTQGSMVGYTEVQIDYDGNGREEYEYSMPGTFGEHYAVYHESNSEYIFERSAACASFSPWYLDSCEPYKDYFPFPPDPDLDWMRGQLLSKKVYNEDNFPVKFTKNSYEIGNYTKSRAQIAVTESYFSISTSDPPGTYCIHSRRYRNKYSILTGWNYLSQSKEYTFNPEDSTEYVYESSYYKYHDDDRQLLSEKKVFDSNGDTLKTIYTYSSDETTEPYLSMVGANMLNYPTKTEVYKETSFLQNNSTTYKEWDTDVFAPEYRKQKVGSTEYTQLQFHDYDDKMNVLSISKTNDIRQSFIWGYDQTYPIASAQNATDKEIFTESFEVGNIHNWYCYDFTYSSAIESNDASSVSKVLNISNGKFSKLTLDDADFQFTTGKKYSVFIKAKILRTTSNNPAIRVTNNGTNYTTNISKTGEWMDVGVEFTYNGGDIEIYLDADLGVTDASDDTFFDELRLCPSDAMMSTYTYDPLIGLTSQTDTNGQTSYYEYDDFGRLKYIKDSNGNLLQQTDYHFATQ